MKVLINGLQISSKNSGVQYYTKHLHSAIQEIQHSDLEIQLYQQTAKPCFLFLRSYCKGRFLSPVSHFLSSYTVRFLRIFNENYYLPNCLNHNKYDLYHSPNYVLPFIINTPSVVTVHDLITLYFPKFCQRESVLYFKLFLHRSIKKADKIITVSETVKKDIISRFKISDDKVVVTPLGVSNIFKRTINTNVISKYSISNKYILFVGNIEPKKNLVRLIKAFYKLVNTNNFSHKLVIAGKKGWKYQEVFSTVLKLKLQDKVIFTGYVPEIDLPVLYSMADLFVFPSIYEGFGIPPLESMACETPVLISYTGALPETTGGNGLMINPYNIDDITDGMHKLLTDDFLRRNCIENGKNWVKRFTWERVARKTLEVYEEIGISNRKTEIGNK